MKFLRLACSLAAFVCALSFGRGAQSAVVINELMYNADATNTGGDWLELYNTGASAVDMSGWSFTEGLTLVFAPGTTLNAGEYLIVASDAAAFNAFYSSCACVVVQVASGMLSNGGESIALADASMIEVDRVDYSDAAPWDSAADGGGPSLELVDPLADNNDPANWRAGVDGGTPAAMNSVVGASGPVITNIDVDPNHPLSSKPVKIQAQVQTTSSFCRVRLYYDLGAGFQSKAMRFLNMNERVDADPFQYEAELPPQPPQTKIDYYIEAEDALGNVTLSPAGAPGQFYTVYVEERVASGNDVVINEIMYHAGSGSPLEYIEIVNNTFDSSQAYTVDLSNWLIEIDGGAVSFRLPVPTRLEVGDFLVVTNNQTLLTSTYPAATFVREAPSLSLGDGGGRIRLFTPNGDEIDDVTYSNVAPWPAVAAGNGPSVELISPTRKNNEGENWVGGFPIGSPGQQNSVFDPNQGPDLSMDSHTPLAPSSSDTIFFRVKVTDDSGISLVRLFYDPEGDMTFAQQAMLPIGGNFYETGLSFASGTLVRYYFEATDNASAPRSDRSPDAAPTETHHVFVSDAHVPPGAVVINELMYHDADGTRDLEFIELRNTTGAPIDISLWQLDDEGGGRFTLPDASVIAAGDFLVVASELADLVDVYGANPKFIGSYSANFNLSNGGGKIRLIDRNEIEIDEVEYEDDAPWPQLADGDGHSLELIVGAVDRTRPDSWVSSLNLGGTPGAANSLALDSASPIVVSEIAYHPLSEEDTTEYFELHNTSGAPVDISGWIMHEGVSLTFAPSSVIGAGQYVLVAKDAAALTAKFTDVITANGTPVFGDYSGVLSNSADRISLVDPVNGLVKDVVYYEDDGDWPEDPDGTGPSLELIHLASDNAGPGNWGLSTNAVWQKIELTDGLDSSGNGQRLAFYLAGAGTVLIDDVGLHDVTTDSPVAITNPDFTGSIAGWAKNSGAAAYSTITHEPAQGRAAAGSLRMQFIDTGTKYNYPGAVAQALPGLTNANFHRVSLWVKLLSGNPTMYISLAENDSATNEDANGPGIADYIFRWERGTPGFANSIASATLPPAIADLKHAPKTPAPNALVTFTARIQDDTMITGATLFYDRNGNGTIEPGIEFQAMRDDGMGGDAVNGDGLFTAAVNLSAFPLPSRKVIRYYVEASDAQGNTTRMPRAESNVPTEALFLLSPSEPASNLPRYFLNISQSEINALNSNAFIGLQDRSIHWDDEEIGTFVAWEDDHYEVFDNCRIRYKGGPFTRAWGKPNWKIRFPKGKRFNGADTINVNAAYYSTPAGGVRRSRRENDYMSNTLFGETGHPHNEEIWVRMDLDTENGNGFQYYGLHLHTEQLDDKFLERVGRNPEGNLYKADGFANPWIGELELPSINHYKNFYTLESQGSGDHTDIASMISSVNTLTGQPLIDYFKANFNIEALANYYAVYSCIQHWDGTFHNHMFYRDPETDGRWEVYPFDIDRSWGEVLSYRTWAMDPFEGTHPFPSTFRYNSLMTIFLDIDEFRMQYYAQLESILDNVFSPEHLHPIIDDLFANLGDDAQGEIYDDIQRWMSSPDGFTTEYDIDGVLLKDYLKRRRAYLYSLLPKKQTPPAAPVATVQAESYQAGLGVGHGPTTPATGAQGGVTYLRFNERDDFANYLVTGLTSGEYRVTLRWAKNGTGSTDLLYKAGAVSTSAENNYPYTGWQYAGSFTGRSGTDRDYVFTSATRSVYIPTAGSYTFKLINNNSTNTGIEPVFPSYPINRTLARLDYFTLERIGDATAAPAGRIRINDASAVRNVETHGAGEGLGGADIQAITGVSNDFLSAANDFANDTDYTIFRTSTGGVSSGSGGWLEFDVSIPAGSYRAYFRGSSNYDFRAKLQIDGADMGIFLGADSHGDTAWIDATLDAGIIIVPNPGIHNVRVTEVNGTAFFQGFPGLGNNYLTMKYLDLVPVADQTVPESAAISAPAHTNAAPIAINYSASDAGGASLQSVRLYYRYYAGPWTDSGLVMASGSGAFAFAPPQGEGLYSFATVATDAIGNTETLPSVPDLQVVYDVTAPVVLCPASLTLNTTAGQPIPASDPRIAAFLTGVAAADNLTYAPAIVHDAPLSFSPGSTLVTFTATDLAGNSTLCMATLQVNSPMNAITEGAWRAYR